MIEKAGSMTPMKLRARLVTEPLYLGDAVLSEDAVDSLIAQADGMLVTVGFDASRPIGRVSTITKGLAGVFVDIDVHDDALAASADRLRRPVRVAPGFVAEATDVAADGIRVIRQARLHELSLDLALPARSSVSGDPNTSTRRDEPALPHRASLP